MQFHFFKTTENFIDHFFANDGPQFFQLTMNYIEKDLMYITKMMRWVAVYEEAIEEGAPQLIAYMAIKQNEKVFPEFEHISVYEIHSEFRGIGYGTEVLKEFINAYTEDYVSLYADDHNAGFYEYLGFTRVDDEPRLFVLLPETKRF